MKIFAFPVAAFLLVAICFLYYQDFFFQSGTYSWIASHFLHDQGLPHYNFVVQEVPIARLCSTKTILTVNGQFPGPTLYVRKGDTIIVDVYNKANYNITIHWHGVKQPGNPWSDGTDYITQCPIQPGGKFRQKVIFSVEEGTVWWHAHSEWSRATVHGAIVVYPKNGSSYPFPKPYKEVPIILGEWWKAGIEEVYEQLLLSGGSPNLSDAFTINGQPGDLYPCSKQDTFKLGVKHGKTYLLRIINAAMEDIFFFAIANHSLTVVGSDASYTKPFTSNYLTIPPGQTIDVLLEANQPPDYRYYMAARVYYGTTAVTFDNTTTTAIIQYNSNFTPNSPPLLPSLPPFHDISASINFTSRLKSLADLDHPVDVPLNISNSLFVTMSINSLACPNISCSGPNGRRVAASLNNISLVCPFVDVLEAYYYHIKGVFGTNFPSFPPYPFDYTASYLPTLGYLVTPTLATEVKLLDYNSTVEIIFQGTNLADGDDHPMHLHGYSFYVVGQGLGNFDKDKDPLEYNLVDPPYQNTITIPINGWTTIRFKADNPGVWFVHCHIERHTTWGMTTVFIVKEGNTSDSRMLPPPPDMPICLKS